MNDIIDSNREGGSGTGTTRKHSLDRGLAESGNVGIYSESVERRRELTDDQDDSYQRENKRLRASNDPTGSLLNSPVLRASGEARGCGGGSAGSGSQQTTTTTTQETSSTSTSTVCSNTVVTTTTSTTTTTKKTKSVHRLLDICLEALVKNIDQITTLGDCPDDLCQTIISLFRNKKVLSQRTLSLFANCKLSKLDLYGREISINDDWLDITKSGEIWKTLTSINISKNNSVTDRGLSKLVDLIHLNILDVSYCEKITHQGLGNLINANLPIQKLSLEGCTFNILEFLKILSDQQKQQQQKLVSLESLESSSEPSAVKNIKFLEQLNLSGTKLNDDAFELLVRIESLTQLDISRSQEITDRSIQMLSKQLVKLKEMDISRCQKLTEISFQALSESKISESLTSLLAEDCLISDSSLLYISRVKSLNTLVLINNPFTDEGVTFIGQNLVGLTSLDMSMCTNITDDSMHSLRNLTQLSKLNLNFCSNLSDHGVASLTDGLSQLKSLGIIGCNRLFIKVRHRPLVLLVEDNPFQVKIIKKVMERYNFDVETASNGQMALDMFRRSTKYELVLMDIVMPIMDGLTATVLIRDYEREKGLRRTPVIIQTADTGEQHRLLCLAAGCDDFMTKPLDSRIVDRAWKLLKPDKKIPLINQQ